MSNSSVVTSWRKKWNRSLLQFLGQRVRVAVDIQDLAQETYLRLLRARDLTEIRNPQAYLLKVASHVIAEWRDRQPPDNSWVLLDETVVDDHSNPELAVDVTLSQQCLEQTLVNFHPMTRSVVLLRFREEYSHKEIALRLSLSERQVRRHLTRAYEHLREALES